MLAAKEHVSNIAHSALRMNAWWSVVRCVVVGGRCAGIGLPAEPVRPYPTVGSRCDQLLAQSAHHTSHITPRFFAKLKHSKCTATRRDKLAASFVTIAAMISASNDQVVDDLAKT